MAEISIEVGVTEFGRAIREIEGLKGDVLRGAKEAIQAAAVDVRTAAIDNINENKTIDEGLLVNSVDIRTFRRGMAAEVGSKLQYAADVEFGRDPHTPNWTQIKQWGERKKPPLSRGAIGAIYQSIKKNGTAAHPYLKPAWDKVKPGFVKEFEDAIGRRLP